MDIFELTSTHVSGVKEFLRFSPKHDRVALDLVLFANCFVLPGLDLAFINVGCLVAEPEKGILVFNSS